MSLLRKLFALSLLLSTALFARFVAVSALELNQSGNFNDIVIFIRFSDETTYTAPYDFTYYENLFNGVDTISLRDYYQEVTYNTLTIDSYLVNDNNTFLYYTDSHPRGYYEPYDEINNPDGYINDDATREQTLLKNAIDYVDQNNLVPDTMNLDKNGDGQIDSISFLVSGEDTGWNTLLWPHKWSLYAYKTSSGFTPDAPTINGEYAYYYTFELLGNTTSYTYQVSVGVLAHETFHLLSATDLYHYYAYTNINPIGYWGLMEYVDDVPSHMLGYMKYEYGGWMPDATVITESGSYTLYPLQDGNTNYYRIDTGQSNEWLYLEYRDNVGFYESTLPESGLIAYRVDKDYQGDGNSQGYYDSNGNAIDEVFIFRPGLADTTSPYEFLDNGDMLNDGYYNEAALSQNNLYDEMGYGTSIPMFFSSGETMYIHIYNVVEHNGYLTFDVYIPPMISLDMNGSSVSQYDVTLLDDLSMSYTATITNLDPSYQTYYTIDGSTPTTSSTLYNGESIPVDANHPTIKTATYNGATLVAEDSRTFTFASSIETAHNPYGDNLNTIFYLSYPDIKNISLAFSTSSALEQDYDFVNVFTNDTTYSYTGTDMAGQHLDFTSNYLFVQITSDESVSSDYGIDATVQTTDTLSLDLIGDPTIYHNINTDYTDLMTTFSATNPSEYHIETSGTVDTTTSGTYTITYNLVDSLGNTVLTQTRTVIVGDYESPTITLNGDSTIFVEYNEIYTEQGATFSDNIDPTGDILIGGDTIDTSTLGTYTITYNATDSNGNTATEVTRTVIVRDTTAPVITLNGDSTITWEKGTTYIDPGATFTDNYDISGLVLIEGDVVHPNTVGTYTVIYTFTDSSGNVADEVTRTVNVIDTTAPTADLNSSVDTIPVGTDYTDPYLTNVQDYSDVTVTTDNPVDTSTTGTYIITYTLTDEYDNETTLYRVVTVVPVTPDITFTIGDANTTILQGNTYTDGTCNVTVNGTSQACDVIENTVDTSTVGIYHITYGVTIDGQTYTYTRYVFVYSDTQKPTLYYRKEEAGGWL